MAGLDDFLSWLAGGTQMGNMLGIASPTASTQAPLAVAPGTAPTASGPMLGGQPPAGGGGLLGGLLGGQQPVNPASYFMPKPGLLGDSPLGNMVAGAFSGLGAQGGGLTGMGNAFQGGSQAVQDRRQNMMRTALAGQQYQAGQASAAASNLQIAEALRRFNILQRSMTPPGQTPPPDLTYADVINDPQKLSQIMTASIPTIGGQAPGGGQGAGSTAPATTGAPQGQPAAAPVVALPDIANAIHMQESGGATGGPPSDMGAIGGWQIMPDTFKIYAHPGEDINNPKDNEAVAQRVIADLAMKGGNDPGRIAVGYVSGPGNMAPPGSPTPWIKDFPVDAKNPNGPHVSDYVASINQRLGLPPIDAGGAVQGQVATAGGQQGGGQPVAADQANALNEIFKQSHHGYTQAEWRQYGAALQSPEGDAMIADANRSDPAFIGGQEQAKLQGTQGLAYGGPQEQHNRAIQQADAYKATDAVKIWAVAKPAADAFNAAYQERGTVGGSNDYAMVEAALQVLNPGMVVAKPGTAEYATQLQTIPGKVAEQIQKAFSTNSAIDDKPAAQLKQAVDDRMAINKKLIDKTNESFDERAKTDNLRVPRSYWNPGGYGFESDQGGTQQGAGGQTQTQTQPPKWTQDHPATLGAGASDQAKITWFKTIPIGSWYIDPDDPAKTPRRKNKEIGGQ